MAGIEYRRQIAALREHVGERMGEVETEIAEGALLALVEVFGDTAREGDGVEAEVGERGRPRLGHQKARRQFVRRAAVDHAHDEPHHAVDDARAILDRE